MPKRRTPPPQDEQPTALDMLDPLPAADGPGQPGEPPYEPGLIEQAVLHDLSGFPGEFARGAIAAAACKLARELDMGFVIGRDAAGHAREIRQAITVLREMAPGERKGDATDDLRARREARMQASGA